MSSEILHNYGFLFHIFFVTKGRDYLDTIKKILFIAYLSMSIDMAIAE